MTEVPRALSLRRFSRHFRRDWYEIGKHLDVRLDGFKIPNVVEYDVDAGYVDFHPKDGRYDPIRVQRRSGTVTAERRPYAGSMGLRPTGAAASIKMPFDPRQATRSVTLQVQLVGMKRWRARLRIAAVLMKAAAAIAGCGVAVDLASAGPAEANEA
jgi:hypothetical protein